MWREGLILGIRDESPAQGPAMVLQIEVDGGNSHDKWLVATVPDDVPHDVIGVHLAGILIITYGSHDLSESADLEIKFRAFGSTLNPDYCMQVCEARSGGVRSNAAVWVPVNDGKLEYKWKRTTPPPYPEHASYGFKLFADAYLRRGLQ